MNLTDAARVLLSAVAAQIPVFFTGTPGIGKSSLMKQVAAQLGLTYVEVRPAQMEPIDVRGLPHFDDTLREDGRRTTLWSMPDFLAAVNEGPSLLNIEELPNATQSVQSAFLQLTDGNRSLGGFRLRDDVCVVATGNRVEDRAGAGRLISSLYDRFMLIEVEIDPREWQEWASDNDIDPDVTAFIKFRPELLSKFDPKKTISPTPRSWERVSLLLPHIPKDGRAVLFGALTGLVGEGPASEFIAFKDINVPDPEGILKNPTTAPIPDDDPGTLYAVCAALTRIVTMESCPALYIYADRLPVEFGTQLVMDVLRRNPDFYQAKGYNEWVMKNKEVFT